MKNMKTVIKIAVVVIVMLTLQGNSCVGDKYDGPTQKEIRKVSGFDAIEVGDGIDVYLSMGTSEQVEVETAGDLLEHLVTEVNGGILRIYFDRSFTWNKAAKVYVEAININKINTSGGSDLTGENVLETRDLELKASGGSDIKLEVKTKNLEAGISGGSDILLSGYTEFLQANTSGGSDLKAFELIAQRADLHASGGSDIKVFVEDELDAHASGGADIIYKGNPHAINSESSSSADITHRH